jgi:alpha-ketoglutaric semialdehyde dehydrogenase
MLTDGIAKAYRDGRDRFAATNGVRSADHRLRPRNATPYLFETSGEDWLANHALAKRSSARSA